MSCLQCSLEIIVIGRFSTYYMVPWRCMFHNTCEYMWAHRRGINLKFFKLNMHMLYNLYFVVMCIYGGLLKNKQQLYLLDFIIDENKNVEMPSQSNVKSIVAYVQVGKSGIFKSIIVRQLNGNPTLSKDWLTWIKASILYIKPKLLNATNHDTMLHPRCDCGGCFLNTHEARFVQNVVNQKIRSKSL